MAGEAIIKNILAWASAQEAVRALLLVGSRALPEPADLEAGRHQIWLTYPDGQLRDHNHWTFAALED